MKEKKMAKWTTEKMAQELQSLLGGRLVSLVLYGSAAAGDHAGKNSDINLLVVSHPLSRLELQSLSKAVVPWVKQGNPPPLFLTQEHLKDFVDVFPVEILDIQHNHKVILGPDPVTDLKVSHDHLRVELEHELQGKLLQLKTRYTMTEARPGLVEKLMVDSFSTFLVLFKSALWLLGETPPVIKMEALKKLKERVQFDLEAFEVVDRLKRGEKMKNLDVLGTFDKYLTAIETIIDNVNQ
jgi:hypothetical protein